MCVDHPVKKVTNFIASKLLVLLRAISQDVEIAPDEQRGLTRYTDVGDFS